MFFHLDLLKHILAAVNQSGKSYAYPPGNSRFQSMRASLSFLKDPIGSISRNMDKYSGTYSTWLFGFGKIIITEDPDFIQYVLRANHSNFQKSPLSTETAARLFGTGLLFSNGEQWLKQRKLIQPAFHQSRLLGFYEIVNTSIREFMTTFPTGEHLDFYPLMRKLSFSVLIHSIFDIDLSASTVETLNEGFTELQDFLLKDVNQPFRKLLYPLNNANRIVTEKSKKIRKIIKEIIEKRRSESSQHHDLLDMLLDTKYEDNGSGMPEEQIVDEILVLLFAGHETTANTLSWLFFLLARNPAVMNKTRDRVSKVSLFDSVRDEYLNAVISEGMRLYPAAWMTERVAISDDAFKQINFKKGTVIIPYFYGLHRNPDYWSNQNSFDPERFLYSKQDRDLKLKYFFPFGAGPRMCIGNHFAMSEMSFILHQIISQFDLSHTGENPTMWPLITLRPRNLFLNIQKRM